MRRYRVVIPKSLQKKMLLEHHEPHMSIVKVKALARSYGWLLTTIQPFFLMNSKLSLHKIELNLNRVLLTASEQTVQLRMQCAS